MKEWASPVGLNNQKNILSTINTPSQRSIKLDTGKSSMQTLGLQSQSPKKLTFKLPEKIVQASQRYLDEKEEI